MDKIPRRILLPVVCLLVVIGLGILSQFKEEANFDVTLPDTPPTAQQAMQDGALTWDQTGDTYYLHLENTGETTVEAHIRSGLPWPKSILVINPGDTWELAMENAHHWTHTITFETEEGTPTGTVQVWATK